MAASARAPRSALLSVSQHHAHARASLSPRWLAPRVPPQSRSSTSRRHLRVSAVGWDPEGILRAPQPGHIARRQMQRKLTEEGAEAEQLRREQEREAQRRHIAREAREVPAGDAELVEFLLRIELEEGEEELEFEVSRCAPRLSEGFFSAVRSAMGSIRFAARQSEDDVQRLACLEKLEKQLQAHVAKQEALRQSIAAATARLHALLSAKDKKEKILAMAAAGELDLGLLTLLDENIVAAQQAQQGQAVEFMEKVRAAVVKYMPKEQLTVK